VCSAEQRNASIALASKLYGGAPLALSPCDLYPYLTNRTLWLFGDSHTKQLFKALQCFLIDFWDQQECLVSPNATLERALDKLPAAPGESKCIHLLGDGRVCIVGAVLGTSLLDNPQVAGGGALSLVRDQLAAAHDVFVVNFGVWHGKDGAAGMAGFKRALSNLGENYLVGLWVGCFFWHAADDLRPLLVAAYMMGFGAAVADCFDRWQHC